MAVEMKNHIEMSMNDFLDYFEHPELAEIWARVMRDEVCPQLKPLTEGRKHGGKMLLGIVIKVSKRLGILKSTIEHQVSAKLLAAACPEWLGDVEANKNALDNFNREAFREANFERSIEFSPQISKILMSCAPHQVVIHAEAPLPEHAYMIAQKLVDFEFNRKSSFVCQNPQYEDGIHQVRPAVSIETFPDEQAIAAHEPSSVVSFVCVDDGVSDSRIEMLHSQYGHFGGLHHLIIVTREGFKSERAEQLCQAYHMGLWRVHADGTYERILSRSVNEFEALLSVRKALYGGASLNRDIVYADGEFMTLPELLVDWGVRIKRGLILKAPYYSKDEIKNLAAEHLREIGFNSYDYTVPNIERLAEAFGFRWKNGRLMDYQLGICNFDENQITISDTLVNDPHRWRFVFCHDSGHYILQKESVAPFVKTFGESDETILTCSFRRDQLRWLEWQANQYARYLLMPDDIMKNLVSECFDYHMIQMGYMYVDNQPCNICAYSDVMHKMSRMANVSMQALSFRLEEMGLLKDERKPERVALVLSDLPW